MTCSRFLLFFILLPSIFPLSQPQVSMNIKHGGLHAYTLAAAQALTFHRLILISKKGFDYTVNFLHPLLRQEMQK